MLSCKRRGTDPPQVTLRGSCCLAAEGGDVREEATARVLKLLTTCRLRYGGQTGYRNRLGNAAADG